MTLRGISKCNPHIVGEIIMTGVRGRMFGMVTLRGINKYNPPYCGKDYDGCDRCLGSDGDLRSLTIVSSRPGESVPLLSCGLVVLATASCRELQRT